LLVTHDLDLARGFADRIVLLDHGHVIETGPLPAILEAPRTAAFWNACIIDRKGTGRPRHAAVRRGLQHGYGARTVIAGVDLDLSRRSNRRAGRRFG
jgi:ABC-type glutathione transport system ATPase component